MSDEKPVPETLETIAAKIVKLSKSMDTRFARVDTQFANMDGRITKEIAEAKAHIGVKIDAVDEKVIRVYDEVIAQREYHKRNEIEHAAFAKRLADHDLSILALEPKKPA